MIRHANRAFYFVMTLLCMMSIFLVLPETALADSNLDKLCVPDITSKDWIKVHIVSRAVIFVTYNGSPSGHCKSPKDNLDKYIVTDKVVIPFADKVNGDKTTPYVNSNTDNKDYEYVRKSGGGDFVNDSLVNYLKGSVADDVFGNKDGPVDTTSLFSEARILFSVEIANLITNDGIKSSVSCDDSAGYVSLIAPSQKPSWVCSQDGILAGGSILPIFMQILKFHGVNISNYIDNKDAFNIVYNIYGTGDDMIIRHVSPGLTEDRTFKWCINPNTKVGSFKSNKCTGDLEIIDVTPQTLSDFTSGEGSSKATTELTIKGIGPKAGLAPLKVTAAGSDSESATSDTTAFKGGNNASGQSTESKSGKCEGQTGLGWMMCPIVEGMYSFLSNLFGPDGKNGGESLFTSLLITEPLNSQNDGINITRQVWSSFRTIANIGFVLVLLFIVFGQATSFVDAYTIKKAIPRLVIAIILVQLSYFICGVLIDIFNVLGAGVGGLLLAPVQGLKAFTFNIKFLEQITGAAGAAVVISAGLLLKGSAALEGLLVVLIGVIVGVMVSIITVVFRKILIILLVVFSPIAFVCWVLPGTQKIFKEWLEWFTKSLLMYPLIIALLASGRLVGSIVSSGNGTTNDGLDSIVSLLANFGPYFLIPATFAFAGKAIAGLSGVANKRFGKLKGDPRNGWRARRMYSANVKDLNRKMNFTRNQLMLKSELNNKRRGRKYLSPKYYGALAISRFGQNYDKQEADFNAKEKEEVNALEELYGPDISDFYAAAAGFTENPINDVAIRPEILAAGRRYAKNPHRMQASVKMLMDKTQGLGNVHKVMKGLDEISKKRGYSHAQRVAIKTGVAFAVQHQQAYLKSMTGDVDPNVKKAMKDSYLLSADPRLTPEQAEQEAEYKSDMMARFGGFDTSGGKIQDYIDENITGDKRGISDFAGMRGDTWEATQLAVERELNHAQNLSWSMDDGTTPEAIARRTAGENYVRTLAQSDDPKLRSLVNPDNSINRDVARGHIDNSKKIAGDFSRWDTNYVANTIRQGGTNVNGVTDWAASLRGSGATQGAAEKYESYHNSFNSPKFHDVMGPGGPNAGNGTGGGTP